MSESRVQCLRGFRFVPTKEELLWYYLRPRITGDNIFPKDIVTPYIPFIDNLYSLSPLEIVNRVGFRIDREYIYVFAKLKRMVKGGKKVARTTEDENGKGNRWRMQHTERVELRNGEVGVFSSLSYSSRGLNGSLESLHWVMHEFSLPDRDSEWVLCRMHFDEKRGGRKLSSSSGSSSSSVLQSQPLKLLPPKAQPPSLPIQDQTDEVSSSVHVAKKIRVSNNTHISSSGLKNQDDTVQAQQNFPNHYYHYRQSCGQHYLSRINSVQVPTRSTNPVHASSSGSKNLNHTLQAQELPRPSPPRISLQPLEVHDNGSEKRQHPSGTTMLVMSESRQQITRQPQQTQPHNPEMQDFHQVVQDQPQQDQRLSKQVQESQLHVQEEAHMITMEILDFGESNSEQNFDGFNLFGEEAKGMELSGEPPQPTLEDDILKGLPWFYPVVREQKQSDKP